MRRSFRFRRKFKQQAEPPRYKINQFIQSPEVRLIDAEGQNIGVVSIARAREIAQETGLDLIEVSPKAVPPVVRVADYGGFKYQEEKLKQKQKAKMKKTEVKGIRLSLNIGEHDREIRAEKANEFFGEGHKLRLELLLRGRQRQQLALAREVIESFVRDLGEGIEYEQPISSLGNRITATVFKKKV